MVTWIPSIYPLYVSIKIPAPWILWEQINPLCSSARWPQMTWVQGPKPTQLQRCCAKRPCRSHAAAGWPHAEVVEVVHQPEIRWSKSCLPWFTLSFIYHLSIIYLSFIYHLSISILSVIIFTLTLRWEQNKNARLARPQEDGKKIQVPSGAIYLNDPVLVAAMAKKLNNLQYNSNTRVTINFKLKTWRMWECMTMWAATQITKNLGWVDRWIRASNYMLQCGAPVR